MFLITDKNTYMVQEIDDLRDIVGDEVFSFLKEYIEEYGETKYEEGAESFDYADCCGCPELDDAEGKRDELQSTLDEIIMLCDKLCDNLDENFDWFKNMYFEIRQRYS